MLKGSKQCVLYVIISSAQFSIFKATVDVSLVTDHELSIKLITVMYSIQYDSLVGGFEESKM